MQPLFNGTPFETVQWLLDRRDDPEIDQVCIGKNMQLCTVEDYLKRFHPDQPYPE